MKLLEELKKNLGKRTLRISIPYKKYTKTQMVSKFLAAGYPASELTDLTYSCMSSVYPPCGQCASCMNRYIAFKNNGFEETLQTKPTKSHWYHQWKGRGSIYKLNPLNFPMYAKRWIEAEKAFREPGSKSWRRLLQGTRNVSASSWRKQLSCLKPREFAR